MVEGRRSLFILSERDSSSYDLWKEFQFGLFWSVAIAIAHRKFSQHSLIHGNIRIKSGAWDDDGVSIYSALHYIKYCLPQG